MTSLHIMCKDGSFLLNCPRVRLSKVFFESFQALSPLLQKTKPITENLISNLESGNSEVSFLKFLSFLSYDLSAKHTVTLLGPELCLESSGNVPGIAEAVGWLFLSLARSLAHSTSVPSLFSMWPLHTCSSHGLCSWKAKLLTRW